MGSNPFKGKHLGNVKKLKILNKQYEQRTDKQIFMCIVYFLDLVNIVGVLATNTAARPFKGTV